MTLKAEKLTEFQMFFSSKMFSEWIAEIATSWFSEEFKLFLLFIILQLIILHINALCPFLFNGTIYKMLRHCVINLDWCLRLGMAHLDEYAPNDGSILAIFEGTSDFAFCSRGDYVSKDLTQGMDGSVETWGGLSKGRKVVYIVAEKEMATYSTLSIRFYKIGTIAMNPQYHIRGCVCNYSIGECE